LFIQYAKMIEKIFLIFIVSYSTQTLSAKYYDFFRYHLNHDAALERHHEKVRNLSAVLSLPRRTFQSIVLKRSPGESHCARPHLYKDIQSIQIDVSDLKNVINIEYELERKDQKWLSFLFRDKQSPLRNYVPSTLSEFLDLKVVENQNNNIAIVDVEAMISMEELVDILLPLKLIPLVVPEFKGITVGGSIQGLAAESSSFRHGLFHHSVIGFEVLLSNGTILWCSPSSNTDLFFGMPGSFGSLGICTRAKIICIPATKYVEITCTAHSSDKACFDALALLQNQTLEAIRMGASHSKAAGLHFLEAIGYSPSRFVSIQGRFVRSCNEGSLLRTSSSERGAPWFFNLVRTRCQSLFLPAASSNVSFLMDTKDYLFRHDHGSFWMASYRIPQAVGRWMGSLLSSSNMFALATLLPWAFPKKQIVLQDFMLPFASVANFHRDMQSLLAGEEAAASAGGGRGVWPVWLLPMRGCSSIQPAQHRAIFSLPDGPVASPHYCNVGAYGIPSVSKGRYDFIPCNRRLEGLLTRCGGRKVLYSHAFYSRSEFYNQLYDGARYFKLRGKYCEDGALPEIFDKVVTRGNNL